MTPGPSRPGSWRGRALRVLALLGIGLAAASPFLTDHQVGTGESYNYSLAVADALTQMRQGELPPLVGQTEYAFNGRIHPLRSAPYLFYLCRGIDLVSFEQLSFWRIQNTSLAFSLVALVFAVYGGLRWATRCSRRIAFLLSAVVAFSPAIMVAAMSLDLYMSVHAAPFVAIAIACCVRQVREPAPRWDFVLAASTAALVLAHPPIAAWTVLGLAPLRAYALARNHRLQDIFGLLIAGAAAAALAAFSFESVDDLRAQPGFDLTKTGAEAAYDRAVLTHVRESFPATLLPVGKGNGSGALQLGYAGWAALIGASVMLFRSRKSPEARSGLALAAAAVVLLALVLPLPGITAGLWKLVPWSVKSITNLWPMQRLYLVAIQLAVFAGALAFPKWPTAPRWRWVPAIALCWVIFQAFPFVSAGFAARRGEEETRLGHVSPNIDLTITSYSFLGTPSDYVAGAIDPEMEFRLLRDGLDEAVSQTTAAIAVGQVVSSGTFGFDNGATEQVAQLTLWPGARYLITFKFPTQGFDGHLNFGGAGVRREYALPGAGGSRGFGSGEGRSHSLPLWIPLSTSGVVDFRLTADAPGARPVGYELRQFDPAQLPVQVKSLYPLKCVVNATEDYLCLETPRRFLAGWVAVVNGKPVRAASSPDGSLMVPVPKGRSEVEIRYVATPAVRRGFWISAVSWLLFGAFVVRIALRPTSAENTASQWIEPLLVATGAAAVIAGAYIAIGGPSGMTGASVGTAGPLEVAVYLPLDRVTRRDPILATGQKGAGTVVFVTYPDRRHIRVGAEIWGTAYQSGPIETNYYERQVFTVRSSSLFPLEDPSVRALTANQRDELRSRFTVELNGSPVIDVDRQAFESRPDQVTPGENRIGASTADSRFSGEILGVTRLAVAASDEAKYSPPGWGPIRIRFVLPRSAPAAPDPLLTTGRVGAGDFVFLIYGGNPEVMVGIDHWGSPVIRTELIPIAVDLSQPHEIEIRLGNLYPPENDPWWGTTPMETRRRRLSEAEILLDGTSVLKVPLVPHRTTPGEVAVGLNRIGGSTTGPRFTGRILSADRIGLDAAPPPR